MTKEEAIARIKDHMLVHKMYEERAVKITEAFDMAISALEQPETCEGCKHLGKWENEVEYGYPSPCTCCKRRVEDHYESRKSPKNEVFIVDDAYKENVENLPYRSVQPEQRWIPVTERLPDDETDILVTYIDGEETRIVPVNYDRGTWFDCIFDRELKPHMVTAWMLRPESYKGDEK